MHLVFFLGLVLLLHSECSQVMSHVSYTRLATMMEDFKCLECRTMYVTNNKQQLLISNSLLQLVAGGNQQQSATVGCWWSVVIQAVSLKYPSPLPFLLVITTSVYRIGLIVWWCLTSLSTISVISWRSILLMEETVWPGENHRPVTSHWQNFIT